MNRLRVRIELNRRKSGVPMEELVNVVEETRKFFHLLAEDVQIPSERGEWMASNFDPESLNFTAEFSGAASAEQIRAFGSAFSGSTSLRRETIAQFTHIADFIGEDELVGFGLYQSDQETEPSDWRCLSRRDALRFADEIQLLAKAAGESVMAGSVTAGAVASGSVLDAPLPAVMNGSVGGRRLFKDRRERDALAADPSKWIREVESNMARRIGLLENEVESHARKMQSLGHTQDVADERFLKLIGAMESFWSQAPRQLQAAAPAPETPAAPIAEKVKLKSSGRWWKAGLPLAAAVVILAVKEAPVIHSQWLQLSAPPVDAAMIRPNPPAAPLLALSNSQAVSAAEPTAPAIDATPAMTHQISLEIPSELKSTIQRRVFVNVAVGIDPKGKVTSAEIASTKGEGASLLATEALKAARWFRFRPARLGDKVLASQTILQFVFDPDVTPVVPASLQAETSGAGN